MKARLMIRLVGICILPLVLGTRFGGTNLLRNGDFESFTGSEPNGWTTTNIPNALTVVSPSPKVYHGKHAARCEVKEFYGSNIAGMMMQKNIALSGESLELSGHYLLHAVGKDVGYICLELQNEEGSTVRICHEYLTKPVADFTAFTMKGSVPEGTVRLEIRLTLLPAEENGTLHTGSYILFDELSLAATSPDQER